MNSGIAGAVPIRMEKPAMMPAVEKSRITMIFLLFTRSANTPPSSERTIIGRSEQAVTAPNRAEDPVSRSKKSGKEKRRIALPNRETI